MGVIISTWNCISLFLPSKVRVRSLNDVHDFFSPSCDPDTLPGTVATI